MAWHLLLFGLGLAALVVGAEALVRGAGHRGRAQGHDALLPFPAVMMSFVIPLTIVTLLAVLLHPPGAAQRPTR